MDSYRLARHLQGIQEALILHQLTVDVVELGHAHCCSLPYIWIIILQVLKILQYRTCV